MGKSLRSKSRQRVKRIRRAKYYEKEKQKCWDKHLALQAEKNDQEMVTEEPGDDGAKSNPADAQSQPAAGETDVRMESNRKLSRKQLLKLMKQKNAKRTKNKAKRLGGRKSHSKW